MSKPDAAREQEAQPAPRADLRNLFTLEEVERYADVKVRIALWKAAQPTAQEPSLDTVLALAKRYTEQAANIWRTYVPHSLGDFIELGEFRRALTDALASQPPSAQEPKE